jgi:hypothetical protein
MIHAVVVKCLIGSTLLIHMRFYGGVGGGVGVVVGVGSFMYRLHRPDLLPVTKS